MLKQFKEIIQSEFNSFKDKNAFLAISGGKDSMTLADLLLEIQIVKEYKIILILS